MPKRPAEVFLNIPYDTKFDRLFRAYICGISAFGLVPRATLETPGGAGRLDRILELIRSCAYAVHDLSRVELDAHKPRTPRFNMLFELGLSVAHEKSAKKGKHEWFFCESMNFRLAKSLSDLNGDSLRFGFDSLWLTDYKKGLLSRIPIPQLLKQ